METDAILTFSQTVEQVQQQGGRDMSRYPAVNELYDKSNSLRPKLALSLDDAARKEGTCRCVRTDNDINLLRLEMLSDMHDKLSQAVKLYDQLLTQQVSHPRWRSPQPVATQYQQANSSYSTGYNTANGYAQWAQTQAPYQPPVPVRQESVGPSQQWNQQSQAQPITQTPAAPYSEPQYQSSYYTSQYSHSQPSTSQQQSQYTEPSQYSAPTPVSIVNESQQAVAAAPPLSYNATSYASPPLQPVASPLSYQIAPPGPAAVPQSPPPIQSASSPSLPPSSVSLNRHNTVSYAASPPSVAHTNTSYLSRSNSVAHTPVRHPPQPQPQPQPQQQYNPPSLPQFPVAPTLAPQSYPMYGPSVPTVQPERQEALLIDL